MKKILCVVVVVVVILASIGWCFGSSAKDDNESKSSSKQEQSQKVYGIGDTQTIKGVSLKVTNAESGLYIDNRKSENGSWVKVYFTMENKNDEPYEINYFDFTINDTYSVWETSFRLTNIETGGFSLVKGNTYDFYVVFDCKYEHTQVDMTFEWERSWDKTGKWIL